MARLHRMQSKVVEADIARHHEEAIPYTAVQLVASSIESRDQWQQLALNAGFTALWKKAPGSAVKSGDGLIGADRWQVTYRAGQQPTACGLSIGNEVKVERQPAPVPVWCVGVPTHDHLIVVRRVTRLEDGVVTAASRPLIVGNSGLRPGTEESVMLRQIRQGYVMKPLYTYSMHWLYEDRAIFARMKQLLCARRPRGVQAQRQGGVAPGALLLRLHRPVLRRAGGGGGVEGAGRDGAGAEGEGGQGRGGGGARGPRRRRRRRGHGARAGRPRRPPAPQAPHSDRQHLRRRRPRRREGRRHGGGERRRQCRRGCGWGHHRRRQGCQEEGEEDEAGAQPPAQAGQGRGHQGRGGGGGRGEGGRGGGGRGGRQGGQPGVEQEAGG